MKKLFLLLFLLFFSIKPAFCQSYEDLNYSEIYKNLPILDVIFPENLDPDEQLDYSKYIVSPYPLIRTTEILKFKNYTLKPGYYLLKPTNTNGVDSVMFKQKGKIVALIPVFEKSVINPDTVYNTEPAAPKKPGPALWKYPFIIVGKCVKAPFSLFHKNREKITPPPRCALESFNSNDNKFFIIWLYQEENVYKMVFQIVNS